MGTTPTCHYEIYQPNMYRSILFSYYHGRMCLVLAKVNNSSTCALDPIPSCFVKKLVLSIATPSLHVHHLFPLYWLLKFPNLNKQTETNPLKPTFPPAPIFNSLPYTAKFKSCLHSYFQFLAVHTVQHPK